MSRSVDQRITDILRAIERCQRYAKALDSRDIDLLEMAEDAIERNLQIIGEATKHLPASITERHPEIGWPQVRGFRNIVVHQYFGVDIDVIRDVIQNHLPALTAALTEKYDG